MRPNFRIIDAPTCGTSSLFDWLTGHPAILNSYAGSAYLLERDIDYSRYAKYIKHWVAALGHNRIKISLLETMFNDPDATVRSVLDWVGLAPGRLTQFDHAGRKRTEEGRLHGLQAIASSLNTQMRTPDPIGRLAKKANGAFPFRKQTPLVFENSVALSRLQADCARDNVEQAKISGLELCARSSKAKARDESDLQ